MDQFKCLKIKLNNNQIEQHSLTKFSVLYNTLRMEGEVAAALISLGGSCVMGIGAAIARRKCRPEVVPKSNSRNINKLLRHPIFSLNDKTTKPIVVKFDPVRTKLFQYIQYEIFCKNIHDVMKELILVIVNNDSADDMLEYMNGTFVGVIGPAHSISLKIIDDMNKSEKYMSQLKNLPKQVKGFVKGLIDTFHHELSTILVCTRFEISTESQPRYQMRRSNHNDIYAKLTRLLDLTHVMMIITLSRWATTCDQLNGTLNGLVWNGEKIAYVCYNKYQQWTVTLEAIWKILVKCGVIDDSYSYMIISQYGMIYTLGGNFEKRGLVSSTDTTINIKDLQLGLDYESSCQNKAENLRVAELVNNHQTFNGIFLQHNPVTNSKYSIATYSIPLTTMPFIYDADSTKQERVYWSMQQKSNKLLQANHTMSSFILQTSLQRGYILTCCKYIPNQSLVVVELHNENLKDDELVIKLKIGQCITQQLNINMSAIDNLIENLNYVCGNKLFNENLTNTRTFTHVYNKIKYESTIWVIDNNIMLVHKHMDSNDANNRKNTRTSPLDDDSI